MCICMYVCMYVYIYIYIYITSEFCQIELLKTGRVVDEDTNNTD